ncbi:MAG: nucleotidyltransferase family protein [Candidatus Lokiarchaeota archaeon]|nr:nucleotidyltransferase family protein [Candidatus Lokiarchaeota archaeon]
MKSLNKEEIFKLLKQHREELKNYNVIKLGLFGSVLRGNNTKESDIDFIVEFEEGKKNYDNFIEVAFLLESILQKKVDLLTMEAINPNMKPKILKEAYFESI